MDRITNAPVELAIAHVLFIDIVGYSKLRTAEQNAAVATLNELVQGCPPFQAAEKAERILKIPSGDGMALVFYSSPEEPAECAVALAQSLNAHPNIQVRMGIHSGSVSGVVDVSGRANVAGAGINIAQRVMDCGDGGHILLSKHAADDLAEYERWRPLLHELGRCEVKHGVKIDTVSMWSDDVGNSRVPTKLRVQRQRATRKRWLLLGSAIAVAVIGAAGIAVWRAREQSNVASLNHSVAVLPFETLSINADDAILTGGVHREVLTNLARLADLKVISRTSVMKYKPGGERNLKQIAEELGVAYVVEGSVQRAGNFIKVTAELVNATTDASVWAQTYDGEPKDVLTFQTEIAQRISNQLGAKLSPQERTELASKPTQDLAAYQSYIRARTLMENSDEDEQHEKFVDDNTRAVQLLEQAVARDPMFAAAYWALSEANIQLFRTSDPPNPYRAQAEAALKQAQRIAPNAGETLHAQARIMYYGYLDFEKALAILEQAAKSLPNSAEITMTRGLLYRRFGRWQESFTQFVRVTELNPQDPAGYSAAIDGAWTLRWWDDADRIRARLIKLFPRMARRARFEEAVSFRQRGEPEKGDKILDELHLDVRTGFVPLFYRSFWKRDYEECRRLLTEAAKYPELQDDRWHKELQLVFVGEFRAETEAALEAEKELENRLRQPTNRDTEGALVVALCNVKMLLGK